MDSPLDLESPQQRTAFLAVFLRGYAIAATGVPPRHPDEDTTESHETVPYASLGSKPPPLLLRFLRAAEVGLVRQTRGQGLAPF